MDLRYLGTEALEIRESQFGQLHFVPQLTFSFERSVALYFRGIRRSPGRMKALAPAIELEEHREGR